MPTLPQLAPQPSVPGSAVPQMAAEAALIQSPASAGNEDFPVRNTLVSRLPVEVDVSVPIRKFRVRDLLTLAEGAVIASQWVQGDDLPLAAPGAQLAWTEFEVIDQRLAVRITRLI
jgi:flagellar motor switch/type III secretory pathway protein FliN